jgi:MFS family permease
VEDLYEISKLNEKYSIRNGVAATFVLNLTNNYFALFAISVLGATNTQVGLINSLPPFLGMFGSIIGAIFLGRVAQKKEITMGADFLTRLFLLLMVFVVFLPSSVQIWAFILLVGFMNIPGAFVNLSWQALIGDLILEERRNDFFGERNRIVTIVGMVVTLVVGVGLQMFPKKLALPYLVLFFVAFLFGILEVYYLGKHVEEPVTATKKKFNLGLGVFSHKAYLYFVLCALFFNFGWQMAWPLFSIFQIKYAHANGLWVSLFVVANQLAQIVSFKWWGRMSDRYGILKMLFLSSIGMLLAPLLTILSTNLIYLTLINLVTGLTLSGTVLLLFNQLLAVTPKEFRSPGIANYNILLSIIGFIAPEFGVLLLNHYGMTMAMMSSVVFRTAGAFLFLVLFYLENSSQRKPKVHYL